MFKLKPARHQRPLVSLCLIVPFNMYMSRTADIFPKLVVTCWSRQLLSVKNQYLNGLKNSHSHKIMYYCSLLNLPPNHLDNSPGQNLYRTTSLSSCNSPECNHRNYRCSSQFLSMFKHISTCFFCHA